MITVVTKEATATPETSYIAADKWETRQVDYSGSDQDHTIPMENDLDNEVVLIFKDPVDIYTVD